MLFSFRNSPTNNLGRIPYNRAVIRNIIKDNGVRCHCNIVTDFNSTHNDNIGADMNIVAQYWRIFAVGRESDIRMNLGIFTNYSIYSSFAPLKWRKST